MRRFAAAGVAAAVLWAGPGLAQGRGLTLELRASEAPGAPVAERVDLYKSSHALVIGIDNYAGGWPRLSNAVADARLVAQELGAQGFEVTLRENLASEDLKRAFEEFFVVKGADPEARLFVWYAGHGHSDGGEGFLVPADAPRPEAGPTFRLKALSIRRFGEFVRLARSKHAFAVFDSCFAGTIFTAQRDAPPAAVTRATTLPVRQFLTSGDANQRVSDDGTFRKLFLRALAGEEAADANRDGYVTGSELGLFLTDRLTNLTAARQTPRYGKLRDEDYDRGDFVFALARGAAQPRTGATSSPDAVVWGAIQGSERAEDFERFIATYPSSPLVAFARDRLAVLRPPRPPAAAPTQPAVGVFPRPGESFKDCPDCPEMVVVPAGSFMMGSLETEEERDNDEGPQHRVTISRPFAVGKFEVTFAEWDACVAGGGCNGYRPSDNGWGRGNRPVINGSWDHAKAYVQWLSRRTGKQYRLLSEAEWEYAARAGTTTRFWCGDAESCLDSAAWYGKNSGGRTQPIGGKNANAFGLHDVHGNVWEWVEDCWNGDYRGAPTDAGAWTSGDCSRRVVRGGSWGNFPRIVRGADRDWFTTGSRIVNVGLRVARTLE